MSKRSHCIGYQQFINKPLFHPVLLWSTFIFLEPLNILMHQILSSRESDVLLDHEWKYREVEGKNNNFFLI